ncbi:hypothetical protein J2R98_002221 [Alkalibacillus filiformis]|uniref:Uncharacterized protein n=1 Tax=Alkalibacillus filiformis TaxID=200990 RepID=A0ABU0DV98_9BACI|nr:hypothetical protein [Alkalibacillus filiformis]MDQ0352377.1 hypothetical protein [Alkalibacillus filiformis]
MKRCKVCRKKPRVERRVNAEGVLFCSNDCYETYGKKVGHPMDDLNHPYIDDYEMIRLDYIRWANDLEDQLYGEWVFGAPRKVDLIENINELLEEYIDYIGLEGSDGLFSQEIYDYTQQFEAMIATIRTWEPNSKELTRRRQIKEERLANEE